MRNELRSIFNSKWMPFEEFVNIENDFPGNYLLAYCDKSLTGKIVAPKDVFYVGMSNAKAGVKGRLHQFNSSINGGPGHSGGYRFYKEFCNNIPYKQLNHPPKLYFVISMFNCNVHKSNRTPKDLLIMGKICLLEYELLAHIKATTGIEPRLNKK